MPDETASLIVAQGQDFTVEIPSAPTTGYKWYLADLPDSLSLTSEEFRPKPAEQVGDSGWQLFHLTARDAGDFEVELTYRRPWETEPVERKSVRIKVVGAGS